MVALTPSSATAVLHNKHGNWNEWTLDSGAMERFTPDATGLYDDKTANPGTAVEVAQDTHDEVKGNGKLGLLVKQPRGIVDTATLQRESGPSFRICTAIRCQRNRRKIHRG